MGVLSPKEWQAKWIGPTETGTDWADYTIRTSFTITKEAVTVYFRANGAGNSYMWQINTASGEPMFRPHIRVNGGYRVLKNVSLANLVGAADFAKPHTLAITAAGSTITTRLDGHAIDTTIDSTFSHGSIGFRDSPTETTVIHDISVTARDGSTLYANNFSEGDAKGIEGGKIGPDGLTLTGSDAMLEGSLRTPMLRRSFTLAKPVRRAWIYASALGIYELRLNGSDVDNRLYAPGWTDYRQLVQYQTYDVTNMLHFGENVLGAQLAPGWYCGNIGWFGPNHYEGSAPALFAELHVEYDDGTTEIVPTDTTWKISAGPVVSADNLDGETYDARREQPGWDKPGFQDSRWSAAAMRTAPPGMQMSAQLDPPVRVTQEIKPVSVSEPEHGVFVYDLGQDITGVARISAQGAAGSTMKIRQAEALNKDGTLNIITLHSPGLNAEALATDHYTFKDSNKATFQPTFTWHGFRYVEITGLAAKPPLGDVTGIVMGTDVAHIGQLATSNVLLNRLFQNMAWSGRDAYMSIPMDCPQRSERLGWTGDANFYVTTATFNFDMVRFYRKWERDIAQSQGTGGLFSNVAPRWDPPSSDGYAGGWGDAGVCVPYVLWQRYGDTAIIRDNYAAMKRFLQTLQASSTGLVLNGSLAPAGDWQQQNDNTPHDLIATAYFAYDTWQMEQMASAIGESADAASYRSLFDAIRRAFDAKWVQGDGTVGSDSQTSYILALHVGLVPGPLRQAVGEKLVANIVRHQNHLTTGFVGTQWLLPVLSQIGRNNLAYTVLEQTTKPSWGYMVRMGSTTVWEGWGVVNDDHSVNGGANSLNHCALGSCGDWMAQTIGGIAPDPASPGYRHFFVHPQPGGSVTHASATYMSVYGPIKVDWHKNGTRFTLDVDLPVNTTATVYVPAANVDQVTEGKTQAKLAQGVMFDGMEEHSAVVEAKSGEYHFQSTSAAPKD
jgi:alpha-L-rhamnosidase